VDERTGLPQARARRRRRQLAEDELVLADANLVTDHQLVRTFDRLAIDTAAVAAAQVLQDRLLGENVNPSVTPGNERIEDRDLAVVAAADERVTRLELEFLQEKTQTKT